MMLLIPYIKLKRNNDYDEEDDSNNNNNNNNNNNIIKSFSPTINTHSTIFKGRTKGQSLCKVNVFVKIIGLSMSLLISTQWVTKWEAVLPWQQLCFLHKTPVPEQLWPLVSVQRSVPFAGLSWQRQALLCDTWYRRIKITKNRTEKSKSPKTARTTSLNATFHS